MIRVTYVIDAPFLGGAERYVERLATALDPRRFEPSVVMRSDGIAPALAEWGMSLAAAGVPVSGVRMRLRHHPLDAVGVLRTIDATRPDVVHVNMPGPYSGQNAMLVPLSRLTGARTVVTEHLPMVDSLWKRAWAKRLAYRWLDRAITVSHANLPFLVERQGVHRHRASVVWNGLPARYGRDRTARAATRGSLGITDGETVIAFVGNLLPHKGVERVIEAVSRLETRSRLLVAGAGPSEVPAREIARRLGLAERVAFLGPRSDREIEQLLVASDVLALPSTIEGLPYTILEAMACGLPVVATRVYGIPEAVRHGETGWLVEPGDGDGLERALATLCADPRERERLGHAARERFETCFTLETQVARMESIYLDVARGVKRAAREGP